MELFIFVTCASSSMCLRCGKYKCKTILPNVHVTRCSACRILTAFAAHQRTVVEDVLILGRTPARGPAFVTGVAQIAAPSCAGTEYVVVTTDVYSDARHEKRSGERRTQWRQT